MYELATVIGLCLLCCASVIGQDVGYTLAQQETDTKITNITCNQNEGYFIVEIFNGYVGPKTFFAKGVTDGVGDPLFPTPLNKEIPPRNYGTLYLYGPTNSGAGSRTIVGARSIISAWIVNYANPTPIYSIGEGTTVCGSAVGPCNCGFWNLGCQWSGGCGFEEYYLFWFFLCLGAFIVIAILGYITRHLIPRVMNRNAAVIAEQNMNAYPRDDVSSHEQKLIDTHVVDGRLSQESRAQLQAEMTRLQMELERRKPEVDGMIANENARAVQYSGSSFEVGDMEVYGK